MKIYHVTYYYLATGMEGWADTADYGYVEANSAAEAVEKVGWDRSRDPDKHVREWGLSASLVRKSI